MINQIELFEFILKCHPTKTAAYTAIGDRMNVTVYKAKDWASGKTSITYHDLSALIRNFDISPYDLFLEGPGKIGFNYINLDVNDPDNYLRYITALAVQLERYANDPTGLITFLADEIPIFHFMPYPELTYFKLFVYAFGVVKLPYTFEEFVELIRPLELPKVFDRISKAYATGASIEIWDDKVLDDLLFQIKYMDDLKCFTKRSYLELLLQQLEKLLINFKTTVEKGIKAEGGKLEFFRNQTLNRFGYMIVEHTDGKRVTIKLNTINSISTDHPHFIEEGMKWSVAAINSSIGMGVGAKREFSLYFQTLQDQINALKIEVELKPKPKRKRKN